MRLFAQNHDGTSTRIGDDTYVSVGLVVAICGGILWLNLTLSGIKNRLRSIESGSKETWTFDQMRGWVLEYKVKNPAHAVSIPMPQRPAKKGTGEDDDDS